MIHEITSRSALSRDEMAAVVIAIDMLTSSADVADEDTGVTPAWRFSGRRREPLRRFT